MQEYYQTTLMECDEMRDHGGENEKMSKRAKE
jgi:hypothetical protein